MTNTSEGVPETSRTPSELTADSAVVVRALEKPVLIRQASGISAVAP